MGFVEEDGYYLPNTILKEDLRKISLKPPQRIIATFIKSQKEEFYTELAYAVRDREVFTENILRSIDGKVDFTNIKASFPIPWI